MKNSQSGSREEYYKSKDEIADRSMGKYPLVYTKFWTPRVFRHKLLSHTNLHFINQSDS